LATVTAGPVSAQLGPATGRFGQRVLHLPATGLGDVAAAIVSATADLGRPPDERPFHGHLTLARVASSAKVDLRRLIGVAFKASWRVESFALVESRLSPSGARYDVLDRCKLG